MSRHVQSRVSIAFQAKARILIMNSELPLSTNADFKIYIIVGRLTLSAARTGDERLVVEVESEHFDLLEDLDDPKSGTERIGTEPGASFAQAMFEIGFGPTAVEGERALTVRVLYASRRGKAPPAGRSVSVRRGRLAHGGEPTSRPGADENPTSVRRGAASSRGAWTRSLLLAFAPLS